MTMSFSISPSEYVLYDGVLSDIPVGQVEVGEEKDIEFGLCFVSEGRFDIGVQAWVVDGDADEEAKAGEGKLRVLVQSDP